MVRRLRHDYNFRPLYRAFHRSGFRLGHDQGDFNAELDEIWNGGDHCRHFGRAALGHQCRRVGNAIPHHNGTNSDLLRHRDGHRRLQPRSDMDSHRRDDYVRRSVQAIRCRNWNLHGPLRAGGLHECFRLGEHHRDLCAFHHRFDRGCRDAQLHHHGANFNMRRDGVGDRHVQLRSYLDGYRGDDHIRRSVHAIRGWNRDLHSQLGRGRLHEHIRLREHHGDSGDFHDYRSLTCVHSVFHRGQPNHHLYADRHGHGSICKYCEPFSEPHIGWNVERSNGSCFGNRGGLYASEFWRGDSHDYSDLDTGFDQVRLGSDNGDGVDRCVSVQRHSLGDGASLNGFIPFPSTAAWNTNIASAPVDPNSAAIIAGFSGSNLHPDFSSVAGGDYGIPYTVVDSSTQPLVPISVGAYASDSDVADAPFPATAPIEGQPADCSSPSSDQHVLVLDRKTCMLYETYNTIRCNGAYSADSETIWDMQTFEQRPWGWTSADAAGLSIFPGLVRYDEVAAGAINHAIRFTLQDTRNDSNEGYFVEPASHAAGNSSSSMNVEGMRIRLKASVDISGYSAADQVILTAMKQYGMILADNGSNLYFQGAPDTRWNDDDLSNLKNIPGSDFEVVQMPPAYPGWDAVTAPTGALPPISSFLGCLRHARHLELDHKQRHVRLYRQTRRRSRR